MLLVAAAVHAERWDVVEGSDGDWHIDRASVRLHGSVATVRMMFKDIKSPERMHFDCEKRFMDLWGKPAYARPGTVLASLIDDVCSGYVLKGNASAAAVPAAPRPSV